MKTVTGNLLELAKEGEFDLIGHGCNCMHNFGKGIAKSISYAFPEAEKTDNETYKPKLGEISVAYDSRYSLNIVNCYTQISYGKAHGINSRNRDSGDTTKARYEAIRQCMRKINDQFSGLRIGLPLIGCGLAGLSWSTVERYIREELADMDVTIVKLPKNQQGGKPYKTKKRR